MSLVARTARLAAARQHRVDGTVMAPASVVKKADSGWGAVGLNRKMKEMWPMSQRAERQSLVEAMAIRQGNPETFDREYYHYSYEQYLGHETAYADALSLVLQRKVHWSELLLTKDVPSIAGLLRDLIQAGVNVYGSYEDYTTWLVGLCHRAGRDWGDVKGEVDRLQATWPGGSLSERWSVAVVVKAFGWELRECFEVLKLMAETGVVFTERAYQLFTAVGGVEHDILHGFSGGEGKVAKSYAKHTSQTGSQPTAVHAILLHSVLKKRPNVFWWCVRLYAEYSQSLGALPDDSLHMIFSMWMYSKAELHPETTSALVTIFSKHGLDKHVVAILSEYTHSSSLSVDAGSIISLCQHTTGNVNPKLAELVEASVSRGEVAVLPVSEASLAAYERSQKTKSRKRVKPIPREKVEAACVRELIRNAPFGGDEMIHRFITVSNM